MDTIQKIRQMAKARPKTVVLPETGDARMQEAARIIDREGIARVILLDKNKVSSSDKDRYIEEFFQMHKGRGMDIDTVRQIFEDTLYCAGMMVREGKADGFVAGASHTTPEVARAALRCLEIEERISILSSCFIMVVPECPYGEAGTFVFADCGIIPEPNPRQLACISLAAAELAEKVLHIVPRVALLSYSTKGSAKGKGIEEITEALNILKAMAPGLLVDGELQVDTAIVPEVARMKYPDSVLGGKANVLIFPDLESGNISYKLTQRLAGARALGPLLLGLSKPASDLSRGCSVDDIVDCAAVTVLRAY
ncbi:MAG: phosphate acyltransferase [Candidatus Omnitrophota bacterium]